MNDFSPEVLFDLSTFSHSPIFEGCQYAWEALPKIRGYLESLDLGRIESPIPSQAILINRDLIVIESDCLIEGGVYIKGPCYIGKGSEVRFGAYIRGNFIAGEKCIIGHATEVKNSIFLNNASAGHFAYVGDSILGSEANLGAGTKLANLRLNREAITIRYKGALLKTELRKFGALLGDGAQTGCNSVTNPGTILGKGASLYPCTSVSGFVPPKHVFNNENKLIPMHS